MKRFFQKTWLFCIIAILGTWLDIASKTYVFEMLGGDIFVPDVVTTLDISYAKYLIEGTISSNLHKEIIKHVPLTSSAVLDHTHLGEYWIHDEQIYLLLPNKTGIQLACAHFSVLRPEIIKRKEYYFAGNRILTTNSNPIYSIIHNFFQLRLAFNLGAIWSSLEKYTFLLVFFSIIAMIFLLYLLLYHEYNTYCLIALGMIMAGAAGNLWDRCMYGGVRDFLDFYLNGYHWPTFNLADCWIVIGVAIFILQELNKNQKTSTTNEAVKN